MSANKIRSALCTLLAVLTAGTCACSIRNNTAPANTADAAFYTSAPAVSQLPSPAASAPTDTPEPTQEPAPDVKELIDRYVGGMSLEDKLAQLVMFGFGGTEEPDAEFAEIIEEYGVGNIIFVGSNVKKDDGSGGFDAMAGLVEKLNAMNPCGIPRLYSVDVEGGTVQRFKWEPSLPSANKLGTMGAEAAYEQFKLVGERLRSIGINLDLAPVTDVAEDPFSTFLGSRVISSDEQVACEIGTAIINGLHDGGCLSTAKHFPGHGSADGDSHKVTPTVGKTAAELYEYDLVPFRAAIEAGVDCVLAANVLYPALDENDIACLSSKVLDGLLRQELGFDGVVISDDFLMQGMLSQYKPGDAAVKFINSGGDIVLCGASYSVQRSIMEALYEAAENGSLSAERIDLSVHRVLYAKYSLGIWEPEA